MNMEFIEILVIFVFIMLFTINVVTVIVSENTRTRDKVKTKILFSEIIKIGDSHILLEIESVTDKVVTIDIWIKQEKDTPKVLFKLKELVGPSILGLDLHNVVESN